MLFAAIMLKMTFKGQFKAIGGSLAVPMNEGRLGENAAWCGREEDKPGNGKIW